MSFIFPFPIKPIQPATTTALEKKKDGPKHEQTLYKNIKNRGCLHMNTFFGELFLPFLASSSRGCSGIEGGGGEACLIAELLLSLPPE